MVDWVQMTIDDFLELPKKKKPDIGDTIYFIMACEVRSGEVTDLTVDTMPEDYFKVQSDIGYPCFICDKWFRTREEAESAL